MIEENDDIIIGVDPGPKNCGLAIISKKTEKLLAGYKVGFIENVNKKDLGNEELIKSVRRWILKNKSVFLKRRVFVEDQGAIGKVRGKNNKKNLAIANTFVAIIPKCHIVSRLSVKSMFKLEGSRYFQKKKATEIAKKNQSRGYRFYYTKGLTDSDKKDDVADAYLTGIYGIRSGYLD